jgi:phage-related protein
LTRSIPASKERLIFWVGSSLRDLRGFPVPVQKHIGFAISAAQYGGIHGDAKPWKGLGGVYEIVSDFDGDTFRAVYTVKFAEAVYVLHAFQKKSTIGVKTPQRDIDLIKSRFRDAKVAYEKTYGKS